MYRVVAVFGGECYATESLDAAVLLARTMYVATGDNWYVWNEESAGTNGSEWHVADCDIWKRGALDTLKGALRRAAGEIPDVGAALQTIWSREILFQAMPIMKFDQFKVGK